MTSSDTAPQKFDLIIVGAGSANSIIGPEFDDWSIAMVERGTFGGTCLNVGCIPSKMFVYAADVATTIGHASTYGIDAQLNGTDWPAIRDRVFARIDPIAAGGFDYRIGEGCANVSVFSGDARFVGDKRLAVQLTDGSDVELTAPHIVLGAGARPFIPPVPGLAEVPYHTSDTVMRLAKLPERMVVLGGGYIACELGYVFSALGSKVTIVNRSNSLLRAEDDDISAAFTAAAAECFDLRLGAKVVQVSYGGDADSRFHVGIDVGNGVEHLEADELLVATGRVPNGDQLDLDTAGVAHEGGRVLVDEHFATNVEGIWACGDLSSPIQLKHLANAQVRALRHNLLVATGHIGSATGITTGITTGIATGTAAMQTVNEQFVPHAVFSHPQVASVGLTERAALAQGLDVVTATKPYGDTAYGWAMEDTDSFVKLIAERTLDKGSGSKGLGSKGSGSKGLGRLVGAHIIGAQASMLIQPLIMAMEFDLSISQMAREQFYIHPALTEVIENCLLDLEAALAS